MPAICPKCNNMLQLEQFPLKRDVQMNCDSCHSALNISLVVTMEGEAKSKAEPKAAEAPTVVGSGPKIITLVEGDASNEMIREILSSQGFSVMAAPDPQRVFELVRRETPKVVIVDVGIPELLGFQIAEKLKKDPILEKIGVILLASIHDATKYKREPESLYGADDYIERHHIQDRLVPKIKAIIEKRKGGDTEKTVSENSQQDLQSSDPIPAATPAPVEPGKTEAMEKALSIEQVFDTMLEEERNAAQEKAKSGPEDKPDVEKGASSAGDPAAHEAAKRLARIIVSDIALYNQKAVEEGVRNGKFFEILSDEISEGEKLYESRVPADIRSSGTYFKDAIQDFIQKKKSTL